MACMPERKKNMVTKNDLTFTRGEKLYEGKANNIYSVLTPNSSDGSINISRTLLELESTDRISAGNGEKRDVIEGKGVVNNTISTLLFKLFEEKGVPTHYVCEGSNESSKIVTKANMIKLEVIGRFIAAGSCCKRYGIEQGTEFHNMTYELSYKCDELGDPFVSPTVATYGLHVVRYIEDLDLIQKYTYTVGHVAKRFFEKMGLRLVDFKVEYGYSLASGNIILCDEFSPDTCRLWDSNGKSLDKDVFRKNLGNVQETYADILQIIKNHK